MFYIHIIHCKYENVCYIFWLYKYQGFKSNFLDSKYSKYFYFKCTLQCQKKKKKEFQLFVHNLLIISSNNKEEL